MFKFCLVFSIFFVSINAGGKFSILGSPKSISFKGNEVLESNYVGHVIQACMGFDVGTEANWAGLTINDPFSLARKVVAVIVDGVDRIKGRESWKTYNLEGDNAADSIIEIRAPLEMEDFFVCDVDFRSFDDPFKKCIPHIEMPFAAEDKKLLEPELKAHKQLEEFLVLMSLVTENSPKLLKSNDVLIVTIPVEDIIKAQGLKSEAANETLFFLTEAISDLNTAAQQFSRGDALVVVVAQNSSYGKVKRATKKKEEKKDDNDKETDMNDEDFPVIFHIFIWLSVGLFLSLLAICYAIATMDPGRDSIIYRLTKIKNKQL